MLLDRPGEVITREEMRARLWPAETFVDFDHGLNSAIRRLRDALGDSAKTPKYVETVGRRGYRFIFPVERPNENRGQLAPGVAVPTSGPRPATQPPQAADAERGNWKTAIVSAIGIFLFVTTMLLVTGATRIGHFARSMMSGSSEATPRVATPRQLTANPQETPLISSVISPDGKYLAYTDRTGLYLRQVSTGETHAIPLAKGIEPFVQTWLPDGAHVLFSWAEVPNKSPSLWSVSIMGRNAAKDCG